MLFSQSVSGSTAGAKLQKTALRSRLANGRILETSDYHGMDDPGGTIDRLVLLHAGIEELMAFHLQRVMTSASTPVPFDPQAVLAESEKVDWQRGERWVQLGLARWADSQRASIRMTLRGALTHIAAMFSSGHKMSQQQHRVHIKRAGSRPHD